MTAYFPVRRAMVLSWVVPMCLAVLSSRASAAPAVVGSKASYRLVWTATRAADHTPLMSSSLLIRPGGTSKARTDSIHATEDKPAFPNFSASLSPAKNTGVYELCTRVWVREASRNKKGKVKVHKRNIGALIPIHAGETQIVSSTSDPIHLEVRLVRE